jgi:hypothetical protein
VIEMEAKTGTAGGRTLLAVVGARVAGAGGWGAVGLAAGGSSESSGGSPTSVDPAALVQTQEEDGAAPSAEDCPERDGSEGGGGSEDGSGSSGTSTGDL